MPAGRMPGLARQRDRGSECLYFEQLYEEDRPHRTGNEGHTMHPSGRPTSATGSPRTTAPPTSSLTARTSRGCRWSTRNTATRLIRLPGATPFVATAEKGKKMLYAAKAKLMADFINEVKIFTFGEVKNRDYWNRTSMFNHKETHPMKKKLFVTLRGAVAQPRSLLRRRPRDPVESRYTLSAP